MLVAENLLLDKDLHLKLSDYGTARQFTGNNANFPSSFVGTAQYLSPELLEEVPSVSYLSDLWGLACTLYYLLAGKLAFQEKSEYLIFQKIKKSEIEFPESFPPVAKDFIQRICVSSTDYH